MVNDAPCTATPFADAMLGEKVSVATFPPCFAFVEPLGKLFDRDHLPIQKAPAQIEQMLFA